MTASLTLSFFPVRSLFVIFSFLLTIASFRFVRFAHGANLRTLALSLRSNAVYATSFAPIGKGRAHALPLPIGAKLTVSLAFRRFSRVYSFRILAVSSHRLLFGSSGLPYCGKLAHPRYVALLHNRAMIPSFAPKQWDSRLTVPLLWSERRDSNPQQPAWEAGILPLNYFRIKFLSIFSTP